MAADLAAAHRFAERRYGLLANADLRRFDISPHRVVRLVRSGLLVPVHRGVYRLPGARSPEQIALAACIACGPRAVMSHVTGLEIWGVIERDARRLPDVTLPYDRRSQKPGINVHRSIHLGPFDVTKRGIIPITRVGRTLQDAAPVVGDVEIERALDEALRRRIVNPDDLLTELACGHGILKKLALDRLGHGIPHSELERRGIVLIRGSGLPEPQRQLAVRTRLRTFHLDFAWPDKHVGIELDGDAPHWGRQRRQADLRRQNAIVLERWTIFRFTWEDITAHQLETAFVIGEALGLHPVRWR